MLAYSDKLAHVQVIINCQNYIAQMCTWEDQHARLFMRAVLDGLMSQNELTTIRFVKSSQDSSVGSVFDWYHEGRGFESQFELIC